MSRDIFTSHTTATGPFTDVGDVLLPGPPVANLTLVTPNGSQILRGRALQANSNNFSLSVGTPVPPIAGGQLVSVAVLFWDANGVRITNDDMAIVYGPPQPPSVITIPTPDPTARYYTADVATGDTLNDTTQHVNFSFFCGAGPGALQPPCCPPDPLLESYLQQINGKLDALLAAPGAAPSIGWRDGAAHTNLSGQGTIQLGPGVTGLRLTFTTIPPNIRTIPGTPLFYWSLGFITPLAIDVPLRSLRSVFQTQAMPLPPQATAFSYTFQPGVVLGITELIPV